MRRIAVLLTLPLILAACGSTGGGEVVDKVLTDFGLREAPEGYEQPSDKVFDRLDSVGKAELRRLNNEGRHGEVKFQSSGALDGQYYKEVKRYESYQPLEAQRLSRSSQRERGYVGYIDFTYRVYQSERRPTRTEASALSANIATDVTGHETYRYTFGAAGAWDGQEGEPTNR